jgi:hypothetical protein
MNAVFGIERELTLSKIGELFFDAVGDGEMRWTDVAQFQAGSFGRATGWVYFAIIGSPEPEFMKIGYTSGDPNKRIASLQTGCPVWISLIQIVPGNYDMERELHGVLKDDRCCGEWFKVSPYLKSVVKSVWDEVSE